MSKKEPRFHFSLARPNRGFRDYFQFQIFFCNWLGFTIRVMGYGFTAYAVVFKP